MPDRIVTLTRKDLTRHVADELGSTVQEAEGFVDVVLTSMRSLLMSADPEVRLELRDFGVFEIKRCKAKPQARNPRTGVHVYVPSRRKSHFKPGISLKRFLAEPLCTDTEVRSSGHADDLLTTPVHGHVDELITN